MLYDPSWVTNLGAKTKTWSLRNGRKTKLEERQQVPCPISISGNGPTPSPVVGEHIRFLVSVKFEEENVEYDVED
ncbi:Hypothetical predicted protein [Olea europaea subsp. europaea]|uniref:Uncharacterized protein n=1 Tax=Olea europaea subsp. europaea TaxID=158383 RepID=A0A8S0R9Z3_OLEEU|nr:Hypothetical predicted protein [Olea europaea subsp. europaea]